MPARFPDLTARHRLPELMDDPTIDPQAHRRALAGLARLNFLSRTASHWQYELRQLHHQLRRPLRILDIACGGGDVAVRLARSFARRALPITVDGCDVSPTALQTATTRALHFRLASKFFRLDALSDSLPTDYDVLTSSLFLHHLEEAPIQRLLANMKQAARQMILISDLNRSRMGYLVARIITRLVSRSPVVWTDGPLSVRAALSLPEIGAIARRAGLENAELRQQWPWRWSLKWSRQ